MSDERTVAVDTLVLDSRCQARATSSTEVIEEYRDAYRSEKADPPRKLPALDVFEVDGALVIVDGYHRQGGLVAAGKTFARVRVVGCGTMGEAIWQASGANRGHGLRRSNADKRRAVKLALESDIGIEQANTVIAEHCGVSEGLVRIVRAEWEGNQNQPEQPRTIRGSGTAKRRGRDGRLRRAPAPKVSGTQSQGSGGCEEVTLEPPVTDAVASSADVRTWVPEEDGPASMPTYGAVLRTTAEAVRTVRLSALRAIPDGLVSLRQRVEAALKSAETALKYAEPVVCPKCAGAGCRSCDDAGWVRREVVGR